MSETVGVRTEALIEEAGGTKLRRCLTCNECAPRCFLTQFYPEMPPPEIPRMLLNNRVPELVDSDLLWACTLCGRCTAECPEGLEMDRIVRVIRGQGAQEDKVPKRLKEGLDKIRETGNSIGIDAEEFVDTLQWLAEEAAEEIEGIDEDFEVPIDREGADFLYLPNPREYISTPHMFSVYLKFFLATSSDWTYASDIRDVSNWAYFVGDKETAAAQVRRIADAARRLRVNRIVTTECGHGLRILRKGAEELIGEPLGLEVISVVELAHRYFKEGRLKLAKGAIQDAVTYHDPCEVGRALEIYDPPRELLKFVAQDFVEMADHGKAGLCCGGGGGVGQNSDMSLKRLEYARNKRDQILATGTTIVTTSCQACLAQLRELREHYEMPVKIKSVVELLVESLAD